VKSGNPALAVPLASGCAQQSQEYAMAQGLRTVTNLRLLQTGALAKRPGAQGLAGTTSNSLHLIKGNGTSSYVASPAFVSRVGRAPLLGLNDGQAFTIDEVQSSLFEFAGATSTVRPVRLRSGHIGRRAGSGGFGTKPPAVAVSSNGYVIVSAVTGTSTGAVQTFIDSPEGARVYSQYKNISAVQVRAHAVGATLWLVWQVGANIIAQSFTPGASGTTVGSETTLTTLFDATYYWDTSSYDSTHWFLIHGTGSDDLEINKYAGTTAAATVGFATAATVATPCSIWADSANGNVWVGYYDDPAVTGGVRYRVYSAADLSVVKTETTIATGLTYGPPLFGPIRHPTAKTDETTRAFYCFRHVEVGTTDLVRATYTGQARTTATAPSTPIATWHVVPISKPDSRHRVWCITDNGTDTFATARLVLLRWHNEDRGTPVVEASLPLMLAPGTTYSPSASSMYFHALATGTSSTFAALPRVLQQLDGVPLIQVVVPEYATSEQAPWCASAPGAPSTVISGQPVEFFASGYGQGTAVITSDLPRTAGASEVGFVFGPTITQADTTSGSGVAAGTYSYRSVYEWVDQYGRRHRSEPSTPFEVTLTVARSPQVYSTTVDATQRTTENIAWRPRTVLYRTTNGGTTYYRVGDGVAFSSGSSTIAIIDSVSDQDLIDEEILYTDGGVLENNLAPSCRYLARSEDAVWFGGLFEPNIIQRSKLIFPGEPIQCTDHPSHQVVLPGECTGLAYMDGQIVAFTRDTILLINSSSGPNDQGVGEFAPPRLHTTGIGCVDGRSVLETPEGVFFLSQRGIELLPRGAGTVQFIGAAIKDLFQTSLLDQCGFSAYQADKNGSYARFGLMTGSSEFSVPSVRYVATLDLASGQWFIDDYGSETMGAMGAWPNGFALIRTDLDSDTSPTPIWYEDGSLVSQPETGGAAHIDSSIVCQRLWPFGHTGWGHVRRVVVAFYSNAANWRLALTVQTDANTAQSVTWDITSTGLQWRELIVVEQKCTTVKVTVSDTDYSSNGAKQGPTYLSVGIDAEPYDGLRLMAANGDRQ
jgi:hypothetical protein